MDDLQINSIIEKLDLQTNNTFYSSDKLKRGKELQIQVVWHEDIYKHLFDFLATAVPFEVAPQKQEREEGKSEVMLTDCLAEFKQSETLDEDNMWYCNKCKEHVQATKTLELFRLPRLLIITLKRFKTSKSRYAGYMGSGGGQKLETHVEFPLEGLNMAPYVLSKT